MRTRMRVLPGALLASALLTCVTMPASAQDPGAPPAGAAAPATLVHIEGIVDLVQQGLAEPANPPMMLLDGDSVRTRNGRAEIVFADGTLLHVDRESDVEMLAPDRLRLLYGRLLLRASASAQPYVVDTPAAVVRLEPRGEYGITADPRLPRLEVTVARGLADVDDATQRLVVRSGEMVALSGAGARADFRAFNSARFDAFERWSSDRTHGFSTAASAARLPYELRPYGPLLDQHGRWDYLAPHGYVWYPAVAAGWRPYLHGGWGHTRWGWTWFGHDRWAWPTHHFGRWGFTGRAWFWLPSKVWGPAWVHWGFHAGYVSWAPLGFGRSVGRFRRDHPAFRPDFDPWSGWTIVPRQHFGGRRAVGGHAIDGRRLDEVTRRAVIVQDAPPPGPGPSAVPRGSLSVAGATGAVRQDPRRSSDRSGDVRRPRLPGAGATSGTRLPSPTAIRRAPDAPAFTPPPTYRAGRLSNLDAPEVRVDERRGQVRQPSSRPDAEAFRPGGAIRRDGARREATGSESTGSRGSAGAAAGAAPSSRRRAVPPPAARPAPAGGDGGIRGGEGRGDGNGRAGAVRRAPPSGSRPSGMGAAPSGARPRGGAAGAAVPGGRPPSAQAGARPRGGSE